MTLLARSKITVGQWKANTQEPGTWYAYPIGPIHEPHERMCEGRRVLIYVKCPKCVKVMLLVHAIAPDGALSPSVVCGYACGWHVVARLQDWPG